jgi:hypothetical protein
VLAALPIITEFLAANQGSLLDGDGNTSDWIEVYNAGDAAANLANYCLTDNQDDLTRWRFPSVQLAAGEFLLVFASSQPTTNYIDAGGNLHTNFALGADGEYVALVAPNGTTILSQFAANGSNYPQQIPDVSYGTAADRSSVGYFLTPTPRAANDVDPVGDPNRRVVINEIMYHPPGTSDLDEFIEVVNVGNSPIDLSGWRFNDGVEFTFPDRVLNAGAYLVVAADVDRFQANHPGVANIVGGWSGQLSNNGERIRLADHLGRTVDSVTYADEGDWSVRAEGPLHFGHRGWIWIDDHDGGGKSLELVSAIIANDFGQNWWASSSVGGTPGAANRVAVSNIAPLILETAHTPAIPRSSDPVVVRARLLDELTTGLQATLRWRVDGTTNFNATAMLDNGNGGDNAAGDLVFSATIPPQPNGTVVEFYVEARDQGARARTWPAETATSGQVANLLYQVDNAFDPATPWNPTSDPIARLIMTEAERAELADIGDGGAPNEHDSDAQMNGTFVYHDGTGLDVRYNVGIRNRGHGTRDDPPNNYRINFPSDRPWEEVTAVNINSKYTHLQVIGTAIFNLAGIAAPNGSAAQLRVNGTNLAEAGSRMYDRYALLEELSGEFADHHFAPDPDGNLYSARRIFNDMPADLSYLGPDALAYRSRYFKQSNQSEDNWTDLIQLTDVLNNAPLASYMADVSRVLNVKQWLRFLALDALLGNSETSLGRGFGDDYELYRGVNDSRFLLIPHDLDTILGKGDNVAPVNRDIMLPAQVAGLSRFLTHPDILPLYQQTFRDLISTVFNLATLSPLLHQLLDGWVPAEQIAEIEQFIVDRTNGVLAQLPPKPPTPLAGGTLAANTTLSRLNSPWLVRGDVTVPAGITLTIEPGVTVYFAQGAGIDIAGRLVAQGNSRERITLTRAPNVSGAWDGLQFNNTQQENRLAYVDMSFGDGRGHSIRANTSRLAIDNATWSGTQHTILEVQNPALRVTASVFPSISIGETIHTTAPQGTSYLILEGNTFQVNTSGDDVIDLGPAEGTEPPVQLRNNTFLGGGDDAVDLDAVDAVLEGNVFMNFRRNTTRDTTSNAVATGGAEGIANLTDVILRRNVFINNDHHLLLKNGAHVISEHNVFFDAEIAAIQLTEVVEGGATEPGRGGTFSGDIFWQNPALLTNIRPGVTYSFNQSIVPPEGVSLGTGNLATDPLFVDSDPQAGMPHDFHLRPTSPAIGTGPGGTDMGAYPEAVHGGVVINEVLARNVQSFQHEGAFSGVVELYNRGTEAVDLGGMSITDDPSRRDKFVFVPGTTIAAGGYLTLLADRANGTGIHLGFNLEPNGGDLFLFNGAASGGLADSVTFGIQIPDRSIGRLGPDGRWGLAQPTIGGLNLGQATGDASTLKINEWFTSQDDIQTDDFIELYNPGSLPVALGGLFVTDDPGARPLRHAIAPLSYIAAGGFTAFLADDNADAGADHLDFRLTAEVGRIALFRGGTPLVADFNEDGQVDAADYVVWRKRLGQIVPGGSAADANEDGVINGTDYDLWRGSFGRSTANPGINPDAAVAYWDVPSLEKIDFVTYMPQTTDQSEGRSPDGGAAFRYFLQPTPGTANPAEASSAAVDRFFAELGAAEAPNRGRPTPRPKTFAALNDEALLLIMHLRNLDNESWASRAAFAAEEIDQSPIDFTSTIPAYPAKMPALDR